jgi:hypothetical protein
MPIHNRKFERVSFACQTKVMFDQREFEALSEDLSLNGVSVHTDYRLPVGKRALISLYVPSAASGLPIIINGVVARRKEQGLAFKFDSLDCDTFSLLRTVVNRKSSLCYNSLEI